MHRQFYKRNPDLVIIKDQIEAAYELLLESAQKSKALLFCGNGGSASDSDHIVGELMKGFVSKRPLDEDLRKLFIDTYDNGDHIASNLQKAIPAISLTQHPALNFAIQNDLHADLVFAQQVNGYAPISGVVVGMSTSGNAENIINAFKVAKLKGLKTILMSGKTGGKLKEFADVAILTPDTETFIVQEYHLAIYHYLCLKLENTLFESDNLE
ncbi:MAG TPA: SIS domain-containing protein [Erysipelothrix sp.]|nr:SIS domain-containing protein [Erysipelothrix sp.]